MSTALKQSQSDVFNMLYDPDLRVVTPGKDSKHASNQKFNLNTLPEDIHRVILSELVDSSPSAILNLAQSSKTLHDAALPFVYRNLTLSRGPEDSKKLLAYQALMNKFQDPSCDIARHVRSITIQDEVPSEDFILILDKISDSGRLHKLSWNTSAHMPLAALEKLHSTWPDLDISVTVTDRQNAKLVAHRQMDLRLLSSPLLTQLTYVIYNKGYEPEQPSRSEWPKLTQALLSGGNIRTLRIQSQEDGTEYRGVKMVDEREPQKLARLDLVPGARLAKLEELSIRVRGRWGIKTYFWDEQHCHALRDTIDPSRLRALDFGNDNPQRFFTAFTGLLPNLRSLRFGATQGSMGPAKSFIECLTALESLYVSSAQKGMDELWPSIQQHKDTLKSLVFGPTLVGYCSSEYIDRSLLETITKKFPKLEHLGWDVPCGTSIDPDYLAILSTMNLKKLDIFLHIPTEACDYSKALIQNAYGSIEPPPLDKEGSVAAAVRIAESISQRQKNPLEWLTLHISRTGYQDRFQPYMMDTAFQLRRKKHSTAADEEKYNVRGNMEWYSTMHLSEELLFEED